MNELQNLVNVENENMTVDGRKLHMFLEVSTAYTVWMERMIAYGFVEGEDFVTDSKNVIRADGVIMPQTQINHFLTISMAKELCMIQRTEKGKQARQYFIQLEKDWNTPEKVMARALEYANQTIHRLNVRVEEMRPKELFADAVSASKTSILIGDLAKILKGNGIDIGQRRLFQWLRQHGYLMKTGSSYNMPTQKAMELKLFEVKESTVTNPDGSIRISKTTKVTGKGQQYFINKFLKGVAVA